MDTIIRQANSAIKQNLQLFLLFGKIYFTTLCLEAFILAAAYVGIMSDKIERVAIIGSGIGGLSFAVYINHFKAGVKEVLLFDAHHPDVLIYDIGGVLALSAGALILKELNCFGDLQKYACCVNKLVISHGTETL